MDETRHTKEKPFSDSEKKLFGCQTRHDLLNVVKSLNRIRFYFMPGKLRDDVDLVIQHVQDLADSWSQP